MRSTVIDEGLEHQIQIRMHGNSEVYVTCNCIVRSTLSRIKNPNQRTKHRWQRVPWRLREVASLGDFSVGTPVETLLAAYREHLPADHPDRRSQP